MTLPIDPASIDGAAIGEERATIESDHETAVERVRGAFDEAGFGFPVEFSPSELLNEKIDADREPVTYLGACNPRVADRAMDASEMKITGLMPCGVIVWEAAPDRQEVYHVSIMRIARLVGMAPDDEDWASIVADTGDLVDEAFARLR